MNKFDKDFVKIALPITIQSIFQASMSVIDQIMTGQLGKVRVAGIGLGSKFSSLYSVIIAAVATAAGIMISQYVGKKDHEGVAKNFWRCLFVASMIGVIFEVISIVFDIRIMGIYSSDHKTIEAAATYLKIIAIGFLPMAFTLLLSTLHRSTEHAKVPMIASVVAVVTNTILNYLLIYGHMNFPKMGLRGAAWATTIGRIVELIIVIVFTVYLMKKKELSLAYHDNTTISKPKSDAKLNKNKKHTEWKTLAVILVPILISEALWSIGENIYAAIYGRIGTDECAAMTLTGPVQNLMIGAMSGIAAAAGIIIGKELGRENKDEAYHKGILFMIYGLIGTTVFAMILFFLRTYYVQIFKVDAGVKRMTKQILAVYCGIVVVKVENMILGGGIIRSGGKTKLLLMIDTIGTWCFGIPLGLLAGFVWKMPIAMVYLMLSLEECIRLIISLGVFRKKIWMQNLTVEHL